MEQISRPLKEGGELEGRRSEALLYQMRSDLGGAEVCGLHGVGAPALVTRERAEVEGGGGRVHGHIDARLLAYLKEPEGKDRVQGWVLIVSGGRAPGLSGR